MCALLPQMLDEDALRFDAFLKENDEKVQEAIKKAEVRNAFSLCWASTLGFSGW